MIEKSFHISVFVWKVSPCIHIIYIMSIKRVIKLQICKTTGNKNLYNFCIGILHLKNHYITIILLILIILNLEISRLILKLNINLNNCMVFVCRYNVLVGKHYLKRPTPFNFKIFKLCLFFSIFYNALVICLEYAGSKCKLKGASPQGSIHHQMVSES